MSAPPTSRSLPPELDPRRPRRTVVPDRPVRRRRLARVLGWIAAVTSVLVLLATVGGYAAYRHYDSNIARIRDFVLPGQRPAPSGNAQNILLVGSDTREGYTKEELRASGTESDTGARSDTVILAHIPADGSRVTLVSFPRDSYVHIPEWKDPKTGKVYAARERRLNYAFSEGNLPGGNPGLLVRTVENLSGLRIDHYVQVDFLGFQKMVDALGGVDVCLSKDAKDSFSGIKLDAGEHHINGKQALAFVRQRHGLANGDFDRIRRQQYFIGAVMREVTSAGTLLNPLKLSAFLERATKSVTADPGLSFSGLRDLALRLRKLDQAHVQFVTLPFTDAFANRGGASVVLLDEPRTAALFARLRGDSPKASATPSPAGPKLIVAPSAISVRVYNGTDIAGLATRAGGDLRAVGFTVLKPRTRSTGAITTVVRYGPTRADSARTLAAAVPGSQLVADPTLGSTVELVVGSSYAGARAVQVSGAGPSPTTSPSVAVSPPPVIPADSGDLRCAP